jgi:hypothetical protein
MGTVDRFGEGQVSEGIEFILEARGRIVDALILLGEARKRLIDGPVTVNQIPYLDSAVDDLVHVADALLRETARLRASR